LRNVFRLHLFSAFEFEDIQLFIIHWLIHTQLKAWIFETVFYVSLFVFIAWWVLELGRNGHDSSLTFIICQPWSKPCLCIFVYSSLGREDGCRCDGNTLRNS